MPLLDQLISPTGQKIPAKDLDELQLRRVRKHLPGQHDQKTHGNWARGLRGEGTDSFADLGAFVPPDRDHELGDPSPPLMAILREGRPIRERFKTMLASRENDRKIIVDEYNDITDQWREIGSEEAPVNRRLSRTLGELAIAESRRYPGAARGSAILRFISDPDQGTTITQRLEAWRSAEDVSTIEVTLTKAGYGNVSDTQDVGYDDIIDIEGQYTIEASYGKRSGKLNGGTLIMNTSEAAEVWRQRAVANSENAAWAGGSPGEVRMWNNVAESIDAHPPILPTLPSPEETFVQLDFATGSGNVWGTSIKGLHPAFPLADVTYLAGELDRTQFIGTDLPDLEGWVEAGNGTWGKVTNLPRGTYEQRIVPNAVLVDRLLEDADYVNALKDDFNTKFAALREAKTANQSKHFNFDRDTVSAFLVSEGIPIGLEVEMARRAGAGIKIAKSTAHMPSVWIEAYNEAHSDMKLRVMAKDAGGTYWDAKWMNGKYGPVIATGGTSASNIHEMGHGLEKLPLLSQHVTDFFNYRTNFGGISGRNVTGGRIYKDSFTDAYSGKKYDWSGSYEIFSNGLGNMYGGHRGMPDDEHLDWLLGLMSKTARDQPREDSGP